MDERRYTLAEVGRNNGSDGCPVWIVLWGNVYDVTEYMDNHPGGPELIAEHAGADASAGFDDFGHSSDARRTLRKYEIGALATEASPGSGGRGGATRRRKLLSAILGPCASGGSRGGSRGGRDERNVGALLEN